MPSPYTVFGWLSRYSTPETEDFRLRYHEAKISRLELIAEGLRDVSAEKGKREKPTQIQRDRLKVDTDKWLLSRLMANVYGDRQQVELTGANGGPLLTLDLGSLTAAQLEGLQLKAREVRGMLEKQDAKQIAAP